MQAVKFWLPIVDAYSDVPPPNVRMIFEAIRDFETPF
jgi:hypothetical protein